jgi:alanine dehydrogenase
MLIGVPKEIKVHEYRVGLVPASVRELTHHGHSVLVETGAGAAIGCDDDAYTAAGAKIAASAADVFAKAEMIVKVKEPQPGEIKMLREDQILFTYLHLAPDPEQAKGLIKSGAIAIAYETVTDVHGRLPLLAPMSAIAGRLAAQEGAYYLTRPAGRAGVLIGGAPGAPAAKVVIIGAGIVGSNAVRIAIGMLAHVTVINKTYEPLIALEDMYGARISTRMSTLESVESAVHDADLVIGAVLVPGAATPKVVTRKMVAEMRPGSVLVDVSIDQGGCFETSRPTTHADPVYTVDGVIHYCVANMPGSVPRTAAFALNNATLPFVMALADHGASVAMARDPNLLAGLNVHHGRITHRAVAKSLGLEFLDPREAIRA